MRPPGAPGRRGPRAATRRSSSRSTSSRTAVDEQRAGRSSPRAPRRSEGPSGRSARAGRSRRRSATRPSRGASPTEPGGAHGSSSSKRNSALPPERRAISSTSCGESGLLLGGEFRRSRPRAVGSGSRQIDEAAQVARRPWRPARARGPRVGDEEHLSPARRRPARAGSGGRRRLVHEVGVLDDEHRRGPRASATRKRIATSASRSRRKRSSRVAVSGVCGKVEAEQDAEQRHPRHERPDRRARRTSRSRRLDLVGVGRRVEPERRAHRRAHREVRRRRLVLLAARAETRKSRDALDHLLDEPRLADARLADDLDDPAVPGADVVDDAESASSSASPPDERRSWRRGRSLRAGDRPDDRGADGLRLALRANGSIGVVSNDRPRAVEDDLGREDLAGLGLAHDPRRGVDRVAEHPVGAPVRRAEVAGEDLAGVDARPASGRARADP